MQTLIATRSTVWQLAPRTLNWLRSSFSTTSLLSSPNLPNEDGQNPPELAPLTLYRRILRLHRQLPPEFRYMGDGYVKDEFRRHRDVTNPLHIYSFLSHWLEYAQMLEAQVREGSFLGSKIDPEVIEKLSDEQVGQLWELKQETKRIWSDGEAKVEARENTMSAEQAHS
ncbi:uncharacterized protein VTP21DRAFT_1519 [Calcarisporiella thermophila]|uniref:uncharacterized protein n=1 Tax=Calcarisporiella thermophila TaxID=911321 RepID=UPI003742A05D